MRVENLKLRTMSSVNLFYVTSWFLKVTINGGYLPYFRQYLLMNKSRHRSPPPRLKPELLIAQQPHLSNPTYSYLGLNPNKKNSNYQLYRYWAYVPFLRHIQYLPRLVCTCSGANVRVSGKNKMWWEFMSNAYRYQHFANYLLCSNFLPLFECFYIPFHIVGHNFR